MIDRKVREKIVACRLRRHGGIPGIMIRNPVRFSAHKDDPDAEDTR